MRNYPKETSPNMKNCRKQKGLMGTLLIQKGWWKKKFAMAFLECADPSRYNTSLSSLRNNSLTGAYY